MDTTTSSHRDVDAEDMASPGTPVAQCSVFRGLSEDQLNPQNSTSMSVPQNTPTAGEDKHMCYRAPSSGTHVEAAWKTTAVRHMQKKPSLKCDKTLSKETTGVTWDEKTIEEHDKERGTRMKIDEPNTPYARLDSGSEGELVSDANQPAFPASELMERLEELSRARADSISSDVGVEGVSSSFQQKRRAHYDEYIQLRKLRASGSLEMDTESDTENADKSSL